MKKRLYPWLTLQECLESLEMSTKEFAEKTGLSEEDVIDYIKWDVPIT